jgi:hypothetical protein
MKENEMGGAYGVYGGEGKYIQVFGVETEGKRPFRRHSHRWKDNIKVYVKEIG